MRACLYNKEILNLPLLVGASASLTVTLWNGGDVEYPTTLGKDLS